ncbi:MAG TPA: N-6 DNA methylase [Anaerolineae bacterium]|nr:N-6 DNA methylase [Anaerolineae bacterium]HQI83816.1 N-6 DNA methylase [Anaerolineae bacterium]
MSLEAIQRYHAKVEKIIRYGGSRNESSVRFAFQNLLESYCAETHLELIAELDYKTRSGATVRPDGTLKDALRQDWGYWESKDQYDDLDAEIAAKFDKGYPKTNILFEDGQTAVLVQDGAETARALFANAPALHALLTAFVHYEPPRVQTFREAIEKFKEDLPGLLEMLRETIEAQAATNLAFRQARAAFLELCQKSINPHLVMADAREMIIQHILTEDIFITIFEDAQFHRENNIARELYRVTGTFYRGELRHNIERRIDGYVKAIKAAAAEIVDHHEKQRFLKAVYENFYKAYNPAGADRLGIVYTPDEIVRFMVEAADHLVYQHFGRFLADQDVDILDPATGTGTFITELIEFLPRHSLPYKYAHEIHCNEVAILPYYIANLNIEYTYGQKMGRYKEFTNICFVDTLDNLGFAYAGKQYGFFPDFSAENLERIERQNTRKISVIIGNPPYNANQLNENENNKNREYPGVDKRIKETYIRASTAQKTKLYDMYARFLRWASDRLAENGVIAFITNRSFLDARSFDGFRKVVADEFSDIYVVDLGGDVRENPRLSGTTHNVFGIQTGVAISFFVKSAARAGQPCRIYYTRRPEMETAREKLRFLATTPFAQLAFEHIQPDAHYTWLNQAEHGWEDLLPVGKKETKLAKRAADEQAIFRLFSLGVVTNRDDWVYDFSRETLVDKIEFFCKFYEDEKRRWATSDRKLAINDFVDRTIKWTSELEDHLQRGTNLSLDPARIRSSLYRPFVAKQLYFDRVIVHRLYQLPYVFSIKNDWTNTVITFTVGKRLDFSVLATDTIPSLALYSLDPAQCLPRYTYTADGARQDNVTDWAVAQFQARYPDLTGFQNLSGLKDAIFAYVYAVLHDPAYRAKYEINLKREFPRIPFYDDFAQWAAWGQQLLDLHLNYETADPYPLRRVDMDYDPERPPKPKLKADKEAGEIVLDTVTTLAGVPPEAWAYRLGNRSAVEWVLEYHKETAPRDPTIREKFNTYRFADYKEQVIALLRRVVTVSVATMDILGQMADAKREA